MSYSFSVKAANKAAASAQVAAELDRVVQSQPVHAADRAQAQAAADAMINLLEDDEGKDVSVSMNGSVSYTGTQEAPQIVGASVGVSVYAVVRS